MKRITITFLSLAIVLSFAISANATTLFLESWGVSKGNWAPTSAPVNTYWTSEDFTDDGPGYVSPGWGGQPFDAEAAYIGFQGGKAYIAVVTGLPQSGSKDPYRYDNPDYAGWHPGDWGVSNERYWYDAGDIGISINGNYQFAITTRPNNTNSTGSPTPGAGMLVGGNLLWDNPKGWDTESGSTDWGGVSNPWVAIGFDNATALGSSFRYSRIGDSDSYAIEAILDNAMLALNNGDILGLHWTMECGNDAIDLVDDVNVPEPSTILLMSSGIAGIAGMAYRRRSGRQ